MSVDSIYVEKIPFAQKQRAGVNCFGKQAHQPMLVSARIDFRETFFVDDHFVPTLADSDNLETQRTMNYATLSKTIANLNSIEEDVWQPLDELLSEVLVAIRIGVLDGPESSNSLLRTCVDIELPKGSMLGNGLVASMALEEDTLYEGSLQIKRSLTYKSLTIPVEIGLRDYERGILQPICIDMTLSEIGEGQLDLYQQFEQMCIKVSQVICTMQHHICCSSEPSSLPRVSRFSVPDRHR